MMSSFTFDGTNSGSLGLTVERLPESRHASRRGEAYQIEGRNGNRVRENDTYDNYTQPYEVWLRDPESTRDVYALSREIAAWLLGSSGYCRLEDTYEPDHFRLARYAGPLSIEALIRKRYGRAVLEFDVLPERYLKSGEAAVLTMENIRVNEDQDVSYTLHNPTPKTARPLIRLELGQTGRATIRFQSTAGAFSVTAVSASGQQTIEIDCDSGKVSHSILAGVSLISERGYHELPLLGPGDTIITAEYTPNMAGAISRLEIVPRWWVL